MLKNEYLLAKIGVDTAENETMSHLMYVYEYEISMIFVFLMFDPAKYIALIQSVASFQSSTKCLCLCRNDSSV